MSNVINIIKSFNLNSRQRNENGRIVVNVQGKDHELSVEDEQFILRNGMRGCTPQENEEAFNNIKHLMRNILK